jgi:CheY-like chemotaxis protein
LRAAERGAALTQRLLAFARRQDLRPEPVDVAKLIAGMTDLLQRALGPVIEIKTEFASDPCNALIDPAQLELALFNLSVNARDAMPAGGQLSLAVAPETTQGSPEIGLSPGSYVRITVTDTGSGMDEKTLERAVEPFFTTKGVGKGTGLGLSMVQGLAAQSGGAMQIASEPGQGTSVTMWLPVATQPAAEIVLPETAVQGVACGCRVLVVDDDPLVSMGTVAMLEDLGHSTLEASSGKQALSILEATPEIDVVVTDQAMPGMTGTELAKKIREFRPKLPIILATGYAELPDNPGPEIPRLSKPYRQEDLAAVISKLVDRA